jgi:hypothetical protein
MLDQVSKQKLGSAIVKSEENKQVHHSGAIDFLLRTQQNGILYYNGGMAHLIPTSRELGYKFAPLWMN